MSYNYEQDYEDRVYEDEFYEEVMAEETLGEQSIIDSEEEAGKTPDADKSGEADVVEMILVCEECSNQWDEFVYTGTEAESLFCPLCGTNKIREV
ncbi:MAG: hypothetical protein GY754_17455 [bacterium]|nr:hypothetical protein [bacterium]